jgi:acetyl esterase/lipase
MIFLKLFTPLLCISLLANCASRKISDIAYLEDSVALVDSYPELNIFEPRKAKNSPVIIFIHGGYWDQGSKDLYSFFGRNLAKKGILTVIPEYTLSPNGNYNTMVKEVAAAIQWTYDSIRKYNGNPSEIYLMGHSAGGHLIGLVGTNPKYMENIDIVKGIILNDAAGLDMYSYLQENPPNEFHHYEVTWTKDPNNWKDASPIYFLSEKTPPLLIYVGTKTYPAILSSNKDFIIKLQEYQPGVRINYQTKKHVPMMSQYFFPGNKHYKEILEFIEIKK